jgi:long-subunit fatty acid transport protein
MGSYNYQWTENWSVSAGYRYFAVNVDKGESQYDLTLAGPLIGVTFTF